MCTTILTVNQSHHGEFEEKDIIKRLDIHNLEQSLGHVAGTGMSSFYSYVDGPISTVSSVHIHKLDTLVCPTSHIHAGYFTVSKYWAILG